MPANSNKSWQLRAAPPTTLRRVWSNCGGRSRGRPLEELIEAQHRAHQAPNSRRVVELLPQSAVCKQNRSSRVAVHRQRRRAGSSNIAQFAAFNTTLITCLHSDGNGNRKD